MTLKNFVEALSLFILEHPEALEYPVGRHFPDYGWGTVESIQIMEREEDHVKVVEI